MPNRKVSSPSKKYFLATFGCQMNLSDSEKISYALEKKGYQKGEKLEEADLVVVNMCSIRRPAVDRVNGLIAKIEKARLDRPKVKTILTGCFLRHPEQNKFFEFFDQVLTREKMLGPKYISCPAKYDSPFRAFIPIMTGCNNFCSYCVVPYTRGREYSRPSKKIIQEVSLLIKRGYKEIWLLGQNVNSYQDEVRKMNFSDLLKEVNALKGDFWIYFTTSHPKDLDDHLIEIMAQSNKVAPYLNLPLQSGDNTVLKKMNRPYNVALYEKKVKKIRQAFKRYRSKEEKRVALSTDLIVGFPGETKARFQRTVRTMKKIEFDMAYISKYSARPLAKAWGLRETVSTKEKKEREFILNEILKKTCEKSNRFYLGLTLPVLVEKEDSKKGYLIGKTRSHKKIKIKGRPSLIGKIVDVRVEKTIPWGLSGQIMKDLPRTSGRSSTPDP